MVTINTVDKYIDLYAVYKKSLAETKLLDHTLRQLEYNLSIEDLDRLVSVIPTSIYQRVSKLAHYDNQAELPWNIKEAT